MYRFSYFNKLIKTSITLFLIVISVEIYICIYTGGRKGEEERRKKIITFDLQLEIYITITLANCFILHREKQKKIITKRKIFFVRILN